MTFSAEVLHLPFYGLGELNLVEQSREAQSADSSGPARWTFAIPVHGDFQGMFTLSSSHLPVDDDSSSGLEMINVLAARLMQRLESEGIDLVMEPARIIQESLAARPAGISSQPLRKWTGIFAGTSPFPFELQLIVARAHPSQDEASTATMDSPMESEETPCSERSSASS